MQCAPPWELFDHSQLAQGRENRRRLTSAPSHQHTAQPQRPVRAPPKRLRHRPTPTNTHTDQASPAPSEPPTPFTQPRADVLVVVEDVVGIVRGLHIHQPVVDGVAVRLADPFGVFVAAEEVDVDAFAEAAEGGEELPRPAVSRSPKSSPGRHTPSRVIACDACRFPNAVTPSAARLTAPFR